MDIGQEIIHGSRNVLNKEISLPDLVLQARRYSVGLATQLLHVGRLAKIVEVEEIKIGPKTKIEYFVLDNGQRIHITKKLKMEMPEGVDGILHLDDKDRLRWIAHRKLDETMQDIKVNGLKAYSSAAATTW